MYWLKLIFPFLKSNKVILITYLLFTLLSYPLESILIPNIFGSFFSEVNKGSNNYNTFFLQAIFVTLIINLAYGIMGYLDSILIPKFNAYIVNHIYKKLLLNYQNSYTDLELGKIVSRLNTLPAILRELTTDLCNWLLPRALTIILINIYMFIINPMLGCVTFFLCLVMIYYNYTHYDACIELSKDRYLNYEKRAEETQDKLSNLFAIYSSASIKKEIKSYKKSNSIYKKSYEKSMMCSSKIKFINNSIECVMFIIINGLIIYLFKVGKIDFAKMLTLNMIVSYFLPCITTIMTAMPDYTNHIGILKSLDNFLEELDKNTIEKPNINISNGINGCNIKIQNLNFGYNSEKIFKNLNLNIKSGEKIVILGESGNGKSTLIKLIMGYYTVSDNSILINEQDINKFNLENLRSQITYINQNTKLFNNTILFNIQYGNNLDKKQINELIEKYNLISIFSDLPDGLETKVGVNGDKLSGGQKQIIQILRAFGSPKSSIIILDEPTASIDLKNKDIVLSMIEELGKNSTLILVTHDITNIKVAKRIIKISHGKIIEDKLI